MKIFLSGGTHSSWQDRVKENIRDGEFFDPRTLHGQSMDVIAKTERSWLDLCDCIFFYLEEGNPSGLGSAFEVGYCVAKDIPVIFVDERRDQHTEWLGIHCNRVFHVLEEGISALKEFMANNSLKNKMKE